MPTPAVFAVQYVYDHRAEVRDEVRPQHRAFLRALLDDGMLLASGPFTGTTREPGEARREASGEAEAEPDGALLLVRVGTEGELVDVLARDPFATAGLIARTTVRAWDPVLGPWAS